MNHSLPISNSIFKSTTSHINLVPRMMSKVVNQLNCILAIKIFTKSNCNLCIEEGQMILKKQRDKHVTLKNKNADIYGACQHKKIPSIFLKQ